MNMTLSFSQLLQQLRTMDRMVIAAFVISTFLVLYSGNLGLEWWQSTRLAGTLEAQAQQLQTAAQNLAREQASPDSSLPQRTFELEEIVDSYTFADENVVIGLIDRIAREARVRAGSISTAASPAVNKGSILYQARIATIRVEGRTDRLLQFVDDLSSEAPGLTITGTRMGGIDGAPWAVLTALFLTNPVAGAEEEEE